MSEWKKVKLEDCIEIKHGYAFKGEHIINKDNGKVLVTPGNFKIGGGFQESKCKFYNGEIPSDYILHPMDLIVTMTDLSKNIDTLGYSAYVPQDKNRIYLHNQRIGLVIIKNNICTKSFLYWLLRTHDYQRSIAGSSTGSTVHHTSPKKIYEYQFSCPNKDTQIKIADILNKYELLISNYQRQIKLLEEAAQRLYKEWFVDLHFPGYQNTKIVDGVPEGWGRGTKLSGIADITMGQSPKSEFYNDKKIGLPFHQGVGSYGDRFVVNNTYSSQYTRIAEKNSILFSVRAPVGRININKEKIAIGRGLASIKAKNGYQSFLFYLLKHMFFKDNIIGNGAIFASITKEQLYDLNVMIPPIKLVKEFNDKAKTIDARIFNIDGQLRLLTEARDRLLPKLMSGEIEV